MLPSTLEVVKTKPAGADDIGRLNAESVLAQYEAAAKAVEQMGAEVVARIGKLKAALAEAGADMGLLEEAAKSIREKGALAAAQVDEASNLSKELRALCAALHKKVTGNAPSSVT